ncbi:MAG: hypothetical protein ACFE9N_16335, partial [Promethearchaeota archaeon]
QKNNLIIQVTSADFDTSILYHLYEVIYKSSKPSEESLSKSKIINAGSKILYMLGENISKYHPNFKDIFFFSEELQEEDLNKLIDLVKKELDQKYN